MRIIIPVNENNEKTDICISFGRAPYFMLKDTNIDEVVYIENTAAKSSGGAGIKAAQLIADNSADILLTPRCGENAAQVLIAANVKLYKTINDNIKENLELFADNKLSELKEIHEGFPGHGGK